ncbi:YdcH family protein [Paracoccus sp. ME4]|uniref:YdcH family protein n=1 Tax=Paracoccus sp. ME4 TaxID=3138066 RepID=UPI00398AB1CF
MNPNRVEALQRRHSEIDDLIVKAEAAPYTDEIAVRELKKQKLAIKEELAAIGS